MMVYIIMLIIFCILLSISVYVIMIYNKLRTYKNEVDKLWNSLRLGIESQFKYININLNSLENVDKFYLKDLIDKYMILAYTEEVINSYIDLEIIIERANDGEVKNHFMAKDKELDVMKTDYNNVLLRYNNTINMVPNRIVANIFHFSDGVYFRSKQ